MSDSTAAPKDPIPGTLNVLIALGAMALALAMLWLASHTTSPIVLLIAILVFSFINNTLFSLLHEAVHGIFHPNLTVNEWAGRLLAAFFPTGFTLQRIAHLGHHRRNRTDAELFDYYRPGENVALKFVQWYGILTGIYWLLPPLASMLFLLTPTWLLKRLIATSKDSPLAQQTSAEGMMLGYKNAPFVRIKAEILLTLLIQLGLIYLLGLNPLGWLACYAAFGFNWSSLQYTDHAFSERDVHEGAWNLRVNKLVQYIFLNYHHHRAHHQHPTVPWLHLGRYLDNSYQPAFFDIYWQMWRGPRPLPENQTAIPPVPTKTGVTESA